MKKILTLLFLVALMAAGTTSCSHVKKSQLKFEIEAANEGCPTPVEGLGTLESITFDENDNMVVFKYQLSSDNKETFEMMQADPSFAKNMLRIGFSEPDSDIKDCLQTISDANGGLRAIFAYRGQSVTAELSSSECKEMLNNPLTEREKNQMMLKTVINAMNATCPIDLGDGMIIERVYDDDSDIIISVEAPDNVVAELSGMRQELRGMMKEVVASDDMKEMVEMCVANGKGMVYQFVGKKSGKKVNTRFSPEDLRSL